MDASAAGQAVKARSEGFVKAVVLDGGIHAWRKAGFPIAEAPAAKRPESTESRRPGSSP